MTVKELIIYVRAAIQDATHRFVTDTEKTTWNAKQAALESGTNIKTINGVTVLGSGDMTITGGGGATNLDSLTDVTITTPSAGQVVKFNGTNWYNGSDNTGGGGSAATWSAAALGIVADGTDQTSALNTALALSTVQTIWFESGTVSAYTVNGTVNCNGKKLKFEKGNKLTGTGTIVNPMVSASPQDQITDTTLTWKIKGTDNNEVSANWYGAIGDGSTNSRTAIQKAIDDVLNCYVPGTGQTTSDVSAIYLPDSHYVCSSDILIGKKNAANNGYEFVTLGLKGNRNSFDENRGGSGTFIQFNDGTSFGIGIQSGKGCLIENIRVSGINNAPGLLDIGQISDPTNNNWVTAGVRDNQFSPHAAFVVDPFGTSGLAAGSRYPLYSATHYIMVGGGGSTGIRFHNCKAQNWVVGVCISPNATVLNAENIDIFECWIDYVKSAITTGNHQTRTCTVRRFSCWGQTETVFDGARYGMGDSVMPEVDVANLAVGIRYLYRSPANIQYVKFSNVKAEVLWSLGGCFSGQSHSAKFVHCEFDFTLPGQDSAPASRLPEIIWQGQDANFVNCNLAYYGGNAHGRANFSGRVVNFFGGTTTLPMGNITTGGIMKQFGMYSNGLLFYDNYNIDGINGDSGVFTLTGKDTSISVLANTVDFTSLIKREVTGDAEFTVWNGSATIATIDETTVQAGGGIGVYTFSVPAGTGVLVKAGDYISLNHNAGISYFTNLGAGTYVTYNGGTVLSVAGDVVTAIAVPNALAVTQVRNVTISRFYKWKPFYVGSATAASASITDVIKERNNSMGLAIGDRIVSDNFTGGFAEITNIAGTTLTMNKNAIATRQIGLTTYPFRAEKIGTGQTGEGYNVNDVRYEAGVIKICTIAGVVGSALPPTFTSAP